MDERNIKFCPFRKSVQERFDGTGTFENFKDCSYEKCMAYQPCTKSCALCTPAGVFSVGEIHNYPGSLYDESGKPYPATCSK